MKRFIWSNYRDCLTGQHILLSAPLQRCVSTSKPDVLYQVCKYTDFQKKAHGKNFEAHFTSLQSPKILGCFLPPCTSDYRDSIGTGMRLWCYYSDNSIVQGVLKSEKALWPRWNWSLLLCTPTEQLQWYFAPFWVPSMIHHISTMQRCLSDQHYCSRLKIFPFKFVSAAKPMLFCFFFCKFLNDVPNHESLVYDTRE